MRKITYDKIELDVYEEILDNGLTVYLCKIPRHTIHARMTALFGGSILEFKLKNDKEFTKVPAGVAHFLEHKLFDKKDYDPLSFYENNGAIGNAFTNEFITAYHFTGASEFFENLNMLFKCVHDPYFTDENVLKEKGIISQEKKEDMDNPYSNVYDRSLINTFHNLDYRNTVLGSLDDINNITKEDLYKCYNTFYHPSNMILTICGDIDIDETLKYIKTYYKKHDYGKPKEIVIKNKKEPESIVVSKDVIYKDNKAKQVLVNYKIKKHKKVVNDYLNRLYYLVLFDMKFGGLSELSDITNMDANYLSRIFCNLVEVGDYYVMSFEVTVKDDVDKAIKLIEDTLKNDTYDLKIFDLIKKASLNSMILSTENTSEICSMLVNQKRKYGDLITDMYEQLSGLSFDKFKKVISDLDFSNRCVVTLEPKKTN